MLLFLLNFSVYISVLQKKKPLNTRKTPLTLNPGLTFKLVEFGRREALGRILDSAVHVVESEFYPDG